MHFLVLFRFFHRKDLENGPLCVCVCVILVLTISKPGTRVLRNFRLYKVLKRNVYNVSGMIGGKNKHFLFDITLAYAPFCRQIVLRADGLTSVTTRTDQFCLCCCVCNKLKGSSRCQRRLATISTLRTFTFTIHSRATAYLQC